mmetsp:Transcript_19963/g.47641  ORF Transcript_19963/g.47641 Transcript_19963/m.47641 type:complete len:222 (+) Transcript_19963:884-1549(+)
MGSSRQQLEQACQLVFIRLRGGLRQNFWPQVNGTYALPFLWGNRSCGIQHQALVSCHAFVSFNGLLNARVIKMIKVFLVRKACHACVVVKCLRNIVEIVRATSLKELADGYHEALQVQSGQVLYPWPVNGKAFHKLVSIRHKEVEFLKLGGDTSFPYASSVVAFTTWWFRQRLDQGLLLVTRNPPVIQGEPLQPRKTLEGLQKVVEQLTRSTWIEHAIQVE